MENGLSPDLCKIVCTMWKNGRCDADTVATLSKHRPVGVCPIGVETAQRWDKGGVVMECPYCKAKLTVRDTDALTRTVMRVRRCPSCGYRCETTEEITMVLHPAVEDEKKQQSV